MQASKRTHFLLSTENLLEKIFLQNYVSVYSLYTKEQLFEEINHAVEAVRFIIHGVQCGVAE